MVSQSFFTGSSWIWNSDMVRAVFLRVTISLLYRLNITMLADIVSLWRKHHEHGIWEVADGNIITVQSAYTAQVGQLETRAMGNKANVRLIDRKVGGVGGAIHKCHSTFVAHISCPQTLTLMLILSLDRHAQFFTDFRSFFYTREQRFNSTQTHTQSILILGPSYNESL